MFEPCWFSVYGLRLTVDGGGQLESNRTSTAEQRIATGGVTVVPESLGTQVVDQLRRMIITRQVAPGTHLVEATLSADFQVSRGPIRDALRQLESEGLVQSQRRGVVATELTVHDIDELYALRGLIELHAFTEAMERGSARDISWWGAASHNLARMGQAAESGDARAFARADLDFHSSVFRLSGQRRVEQVWRQYEPTFGVLLDLTNAQDRDLHPTFADHQALLVAVQNHDAETLSALLAEHMSGSRDRLLRAYGSMTAAGPENGQR